ncbi:MAG: efflux RND transporter permease subunit [Desulfuromonadales bacterium]
MIWNFCIRRPVLTTVVFLAIVIFGGFGYQQLPLREYPDVDFPIVNVSVVLPGADPEVIETEVIEPLEEQLNTIEGIEEITSTAREQVGTVTVEFSLYRDVDVAAQDVRDRVSRARPEMADNIEEPIVRKIDPDAQAVLWFAMQGDERWDPVRLTQFVEDRVKEPIEGLKGVGQVQIGGERRYAVRVQLDPERLSAHNMTVQDVVRVIREENVDVPSGRITSEKREFLVKTEGQFDSAEPFNDLIIAWRDGSPVRLADVGQAVAAVENERTTARFKGEPSVGVGVVKQSDANTVAMADLVRERMSELAEEFPPGVRYTLASDQSVFVEQNINDLIRTIFIATALVFLVVLLVLGTVRGTFIATLAIPTSLLTGMALIHYLGFSLNTLSMLGFILAIGILVDDAIIILESSYRHMEQGADPKPAARTGTTEIAFAAIANTLSLAAVFIPVAFMPGMIGRFFYEFGLTVAVTVFASTLTALTLTPMLCSRFLRVPPPEHRPWLLRLTDASFERLEKIYRPLLKTALRFRWTTVMVGLAAFGTGLFAFTLLETEFAPSADRGEFIISFETVEGASLAATDQYAQQIEEALLDVPEIRNFFLAIGLSRTGPGKVNEGIVFTRLVPLGQRQANQEQVMDDVRDRIREMPGVRAVVLSGGGPLGAEAPLQVVLKNPDLEALADVQEDVLDWMRSEPEFTGVRSNTQLDKPEVRVWINREKASSLDVSVSEIANTLRFIFGEPNISTIDRESERYDVITEISDEKTVPDTIKRLYVRSGGGDMISLDNLVIAEEGIGPNEIHHFNRSRSVTLSAQNPSGVPLGTALNKLQDYLDTTLPPGFNVSVAGEAQDFRESFFYLSMTLIASIIFIYLVLAGQFESFLHPFTILLTMPLAGLGAFGALYLFGMTFNIFSFIGIIFLTGLVTKTGILLVDYTNVLVTRGLPRSEAVRQAAETRFRPVLMTSASTFLGMLPIALGYGAGGASRAPLGVVVTMGNFVSTALTLLVIPVAYLLLSDLQERVVRHPRMTLAVVLGAAILAALGMWRLFL